METRTQATQQYLTFRIVDEQYAITILRVREILEFGGVTRVPSMPACIRGVLNLRGRVLPVVDLATKFGSAPSEATKQTCVIVVEVEHEGQQTSLGLIADSVNEVVELAADQIVPAPSFGTPAHASFLVGMGNIAGSFIMILDVDKLLSLEELISGETFAPLAMAGVAETEPAQHEG